MKNLFFLIAVSTLLISCSKLSEQEIIEADSLKIAEAKVNNDASGILPTDLEIFEIAIPGATYTLKDVDRYYKNEIPLHKEKHYYNSLKSFTINGLFLHGILESDNYEMINYYTEELLNIPCSGLNLELFPKFLKKMESNWTKEKINHYSNEFIAKNRKHYKLFPDKSKTNAYQKLDELENWVKGI